MADNEFPKLSPARKEEGSGDEAVKPMRREPAMLGNDGKR